MNNFNLDEEEYSGSSMGTGPRGIGVPFNESNDNPLTGKSTILSGIVNGQTDEEISKSIGLDKTYGFTKALNDAVPLYEIERHIRKYKPDVRLYDEKPIIKHREAYTQLAQKGAFDTLFKDGLTNKSISELLNLGREFNFSGALEQGASPDDILDFLSNSPDTGLNLPSRKERQIVPNTEDPRTGAETDAELQEDYHRAITGGSEEQDTLQRDRQDYIDRLEKDVHLNPKAQGLETPAIDPLAFMVENAAVEGAIKGVALSAKVLAPIVKGGVNLSRKVKNHLLGMTDDELNQAAKSISMLENQVGIPLNKMFMFGTDPVTFLERNNINKTGKLLRDLDVAKTKMLNLYTDITKGLDSKNLLGVAKDANVFKSANVIRDTLKTHNKQIKEIESNLYKARDEIPIDIKLNGEEVRESLRANIGLIGENSTSWKKVNKQIDRLVSPDGSLDLQSVKILERTINGRLFNKQGKVSKGKVDESKVLYDLKSSLNNKVNSELKALGPDGEAYIELANQASNFSSLRFKLFENTGLNNKDILSAIEKGNMTPLYDKLSGSAGYENLLQFRKYMADGSKAIPDSIRKANPELVNKLEQFSKEEGEKAYQAAVGIYINKKANLVDAPGSLVEGSKSIIGGKEAVSLGELSSGLKNINARDLRLIEEVSGKEAAAQFESFRAITLKLHELEEASKFASTGIKEGPGTYILSGSGFIGKKVGRAIKLMNDSIVSSIGKGTEKILTHNPVVNYAAGGAIGSAVESSTNPEATAYDILRSAILGGISVHALSSATKNLFEDSLSIVAKQVGSGKSLVKLRDNSKAIDAYANLVKVKSEILGQNRLGSGSIIHNLGLQGQSMMGQDSPVDYSAVVKSSKEPISKPKRTIWDVVMEDSPTK